MPSPKSIPRRIPKSKPISFRVGELLIKEGFVQHRDLRRALEIQKRGSEEATLPLGALMVQKKLINEEQLKALTEHPDLRKTIGMLLVQRGVINEKQLEACLRAKGPNELLGQVLLRRGLITKEELDDVLREQSQRVRIGELAHNLKLISEEALDKVVRIKSGHRTLGEIMCDIGLITIDDLNYILEKYGKHLRFGDILIKQGLITEAQYQKALQEQNYTRQKLGRILVQRNYITTYQLYTALSRQFNLPFRTLGGFEFDSRQRRTLTGIVSEKHARQHRILPLSLQNEKLQVGIADPYDKRSLGNLKSLFPDWDVEIVLISQEKYDELFNALYATSAAERNRRPFSGIQDMELIELDLQSEKLEDEHVNDYGGSDMMADQVVNFIIRYGITKGASDIHLEQDRQGARLRYRVDGICKELEIDWLIEKLQEMPNAIVSRIKVLANLDIAERRLPQDGVFRVNYHDPASDRRFDLDFRVATCPAIVNENVTIRILDSRKAKVGLEKLNHSPHVLKPIKRMFKSAAGMILVTGPTGSGKSSTLYAALRYVYHPGIKIITAEDPIEYSFPGIMQTQVKPKIGLTFVRLLRSFLRLDPDVILVGEIRDDETASIAFDAAQTGHLMLSTLHTNDAISAVSRLLDLGIEYNQIAASLMGVLAQRLVRKTCSNCKRPYRPPQEEWELFFRRYPEHLTFYKGIGCKSCGYSGYKGRTLISELFEINRELALALSRGVSETQLKRIALAGGMKTMIDDGLLKLDQITLSEIIRVVPIEMVKEFASRRKDPVIGIPGSPEAMPPSYCERVSIQLSHPEAENSLVDHLFGRYQDLRKSMGLAPTPDEPEKFRHVIAQSYDQVASRHGCRQVQFELVAQGGKVTISATAVQEHP